MPGTRTVSYTHLLVAVVFVVVMTNAERRITIQYAKRVVGRKQMGDTLSVQSVDIRCV